jgi:hypothetical protein
MFETFPRDRQQQNMPWQRERSADSNTNSRSVLQQRYCELIPQLRFGAHGEILEMLGLMPTPRRHDRQCDIHLFNDFG